MRRIKFRAWHKREQKMYTVTTMHCDYEGHELVMLAGSEIKTEEFWVDDDVELMQFTGIIDKNGKEIYEGDIVTCASGLGWIVWDHQKGAWRVQSHAWRLFLDDEVFEIIGNIKENHELTV